MRTCVRCGHEGCDVQFCTNYQGVVQNVCKACFGRPDGSVCEECSKEWVDGSHIRCTGGYVKDVVIWDEWVCYARSNGAFGCKGYTCENKGCRLCDYYSDPAMLRKAGGSVEF